MAVGEVGAPALLDLLLFTGLARSSASGVLKLDLSRGSHYFIGH
jgi:hypothetical protein